MKCLKISWQKHKIGSLVLSFRYKTNYIKTCSYLHAHFSETMKAVENLLRKAYGETLNYWKDICCRYILELPLWDNSNVYLQHMLLEIRKLNLNLHLNPVACPLFFASESSQISNQYYNTCHYTTNCLYLDNSYTSKFAHSLTKTQDKSCRYMGYEENTWLPGLRQCSLLTYRD